jgi:hypothetical protein
MIDRPPHDPASLHVTCVEHQLTRDEIVPVVYWQVARIWQNWVLPVAGVCLVVAGAIVLGVDSNDRIAWVVMLTLGIVLLVIVAVIGPLTPKRIWKRVGRQFEVRTLDVSEEGIHRHTELNDSMMRWGMFSKAFQRGDLYLLKVAEGRGYFIIPKRAFVSNADELTFRSLVEQTIPTHFDAAGAGAP